MTCANRGELTLISPLMVGVGGPEYSGKPVGMDQPVGTLMTQNHRAQASACIVQAGHGERSGAKKRRSHGVNDICGPIGTVTEAGALRVAVFLISDYGTENTSACDSPTPAITQQVHMCGDSVSPPPMAAIAEANDPWRAEQCQAHAA
ncbi:hypothetical protein ALQ29_04852 [Pseudomonas marginalis pv. marginalis]|uniref:Uncharacterized protein n=2 Tax=Pseudomonas marginalis TaxID=298 RepID=A0A3M3W6M3_PSEMA|nr:hypothetical protein AO064_07645 [Pseudomonas marginalis]RMO53230.1 hypothetical protein ALQ38_04238 [Pseudomonas marginalis pv. marginalis]RMP10412.1 hypothetical protein ALQ29_04852 [Pseudomonas marginalis pv. marginalis]